MIAYVKPYVTYFLGKKAIVKSQILKVTSRFFNAVSYPLQQLGDMLKTGPTITMTPQ